MARENIKNISNYIYIRCNVNIMKNDRVNKGKLLSDILRLDDYRYDNLMSIYSSIEPIDIQNFVNDNLNEQRVEVSMETPPMYDFNSN